MTKRAVLISLMLSVLSVSAMPAPVKQQSGHVEPPSQRETETPQSKAQPAPNASGGEHIEWGYTGPAGPDHWAEMSEDYGICSRGQQESPVDLRNAVPAALGKLAIDWRAVPLRVTNNGHTIQVDAPKGSTMSVGGQLYSLVQLHIHHPSEHLLNGRRFPLELHFVHQGPNGVLGVVGVFVEQGRPNPTLQTVLDAMPAKRGTTNTIDGKTLDLNALRPRGSTFYRYEGSLTTPPCSETVDWVVMGQTIQASEAQINAFERVYPMNARPVQVLNRRFLLRSS